MLLNFKYKLIYLKIHSRINKFINVELKILKDIKQ